MQSQECDEENNFSRPDERNVVMNRSFGLDWYSCSTIRFARSLAAATGSGRDRVTSGGVDSWGWTGPEATWIGNKKVRLF